MKHINEIICIVLMFVFILTGCAEHDSAKKHDKLSGTYNIEEFLELMQPVFEKEEKAMEYATEEEKSKDYAEAEQEGLKEIGFRGGEMITLSGKMDYFFGSPTQHAAIALTDKKGEHSVYISGDYDDIGWAALLEEDSNLKVSFEVKRSDDNNLSFVNCKIISPSKITYKSDCKPKSDKAVVMGKVTDVRTFNMSDKEIDKAMDALSVLSDSYWWYSAMKYAENYIIIEDDKGYKIGTFVNKVNSQSIKIGDKVGCYGEIRKIDFENLPNKFVDMSVLNRCYVFEE